MMEVLKSVGTGAAEVIGASAVCCVFGGVFVKNPPAWLKIVSLTGWTLLLLFALGYITRNA